MNRFPRRIHLSVPHMGPAELGYVEGAFAANWLSTVGPNLDALEAGFSGLVGRPAVALSCGTAAIHLGLRLLGIGPGDEVVTPTLTFAASCNPVRYVGGLPIFMDCEPSTWNLDPELLSEFLERRARVNRLPKAVTVVHLFGQSADLDPILEICRRYEMPLLEDAAESLGGRYKGRHPGTLGEIGAYSFNGNKIITGTSGGMLVAQRQEWADKVRFWSTQARDVDPQGIKNYVHSELGYNYRLSNVLAGIVRGQLEVLELRVQQRRGVFERYRQAFADLPGIEPQPEATFGDRRWEMGDGRSGIGDREPQRYPHETNSALRAPTSDAAPNPELRTPISNPRLLSTVAPPTGSLHTRWLSCFVIDETAFGVSAADLIRRLEAANVEARPVWKPMHEQLLYRDCERVGGEVAEDLNRRGICLPSSSSLSEEEQHFVIEQVRAAWAGSRGKPVARGTAVR